MPPGPFTNREAQEILGAPSTPVRHEDMDSEGKFVLHDADHAIGLDVHPSPFGKRLDAVTVCDGIFADTWRAKDLGCRGVGVVRTRLWFLRARGIRYPVAPSTRFTHRKRRGGAEGGKGFRNPTFPNDALSPGDLLWRFMTPVEGHDALSPPLWRFMTPGDLLWWFMTSCPLWRFPSCPVPWGSP